MTGCGYTVLRDSLKFDQTVGLMTFYRKKGRRHGEMLFRRGCSYGLMIRTVFEI